MGCGWFGKPLAIDLITNGFTVKGTTTSLNKIKQLQKLGIIPSLFSLETTNNLTDDFLNSEVLIIAIPSKNIQAFQQIISDIEVSKIKKIIFISSTSVYKDENKVVTEDSNLLNSPLVEIENLVRNNKHFKTTILRFGGLFGYDRKPGKFFKENPIPNPNGFVNMIHRDDCISLVKEIISKNCFNEVFNGVADTHPTRREFYTKASIVLGKNKPDFIETSENTFKIVSNQKSKEKLQFSYIYGDLLASL